jgi:hypothetical protein
VEDIQKFIHIHLPYNVEIVLGYLESKENKAIPVTGRGGP